MLQALFGHCCWDAHDREITALPFVAGISSPMPSVAMSQSKSGAFRMHR